MCSSSTPTGTIQLHGRTPSGPHSKAGGPAQDQAALTEHPGLALHPPPPEAHPRCWKRLWDQRLETRPSTSLAPGPSCCPARHCARPSAARDDTHSATQLAERTALGCFVEYCERVSPLITRRDTAEAILTFIQCASMTGTVVLVLAWRTLLRPLRLREMIIWGISLAELVAAIHISYSMR